MKIIGICGSSCAFKSSLAKALYTKYPDDVSIIHMDNYFKSFPGQDRYLINLDQPASVDFDLLIKHLTTLKNNQSIESPIFCDLTQQRIKQTQLVLPKKILILEGIFIFYPKTLRSLIDEKIFIDADITLCLLRKIRRNCQLRNVDIQKVLDSFEHQVYPGYQKYIKPMQKYADLHITAAHFEQTLAALEAAFKKIQAD